MKKHYLLIFGLVVMLMGNGISPVSATSSIEDKLNLANNTSYTWTYDASSQSWTSSVVTAVTSPEIEEEQGVSICVPANYVKGIDTNRDGKVDITEENYSQQVNGNMIIDKTGQVVSSNKQTYTATSCPVIINTGAAGYSSQTSQKASSEYAKEGYINVACGNRGKQDSVTDSSGNTYYTGDAPLCLVDQKNAVRFVKYNILLGNIPGNVNYFVSTGGSGGGAHATMLAATSNNEDYYDYEIKAGAVGVYKNTDGSYDTSVVINGKRVAISDGVWGCIAYSAITPLSSADMAMAFEYYLDTSYSFNTNFQKKLASYLAKKYMSYINSQKLSIDEKQVGLDINNDGDQEDRVLLAIEYDKKKYASTNGYGGTYLNYYLATMINSLQSYLDNLDYSEGWTWFDKNGNALSDEEVSKMSTKDKAKAFIEGRYAKVENSYTGQVGTPKQGHTQSSSSGVNANNYSSFKEMYEAYKSDINDISSGDKYGNNIVDLYDPMVYIGKKTTDNPTWSRIVMGAAEGDMSMMSSLQLQAKWLSVGTDAKIEWQWDGGHVPSEVLGDSFSLYVDQMYGKYVNNKEIVKSSTKQVKNGTATKATGTNISSWVNEDGSFTLKAAVSYRTHNANKATPGFDVMDYGQEDYVFGNASKDARHWDKYVLEVFKEHYEELEKIFNQEVATPSYVYYLIIAGSCLGLIIIVLILFKVKEIRG